MKKNILVVAAHPDDEILGCGGSIARHVKEGNHVEVFLMAQGLASRDNKKVADGTALKVLRAAALKANEKLGVSRVEFFDFPDNQMDSVPLLEVAQAIEAKVKNHAIHEVYCHHYGDLNVDHQVVHNAVLTAFRPQPGSSVQAIYTFEVPSSTEWRGANIAQSFNPQSFRDIHRTLSLKLEALECYQSEMRPWPHARSLKAVEALARWRGATVGLEAAEAFMVLREVYNSKI